MDILFRFVVFVRGGDDADACCSGLGFGCFDSAALLGLLVAFVTATVDILLPQPAILSLTEAPAVVAGLLTGVVSVARGGVASGVDATAFFFLFGVVS